MQRSSTNWKVGFFVVVCLVVLGGMLLSFSKGTRSFTATYSLRLKTTNVGGLIPGARVLMSGVPIGSVERMELDTQTNTVTIHLRVEAKFPVHQDSRFHIESAGFLGDQYVMIKRGPNRLPAYEDGAVVTCEEPFDLQETARAASGFIARIDETAKKLNAALTRVDEMVLNATTLSNISTTVATLRQISEKGRGTVERIDGVVADNGPALRAGISNLVVFTEKLNRTADDLAGLVATNRPGVEGTVKNIESATVMMNDLLSDVRSGKGLLGGVLQDEALKGSMGQLVTNLTLLSSNLNRYGLLYKPKTALPKPAKAVSLAPEPARRK